MILEETIKKHILEMNFRGKIIDIKEGNSGKVYIIDNGENVSPRLIAYKTLKNCDEEKVIQFENEIKNWFSCQNAYLVKPFYVQTILDEKYVCMPALEGSLGDLLTNEMEIDEIAALIYILQITKGLINLNSYGIMNHQDLNPPNILYKDLSKHFHEFPSSVMHHSFKNKLYISDLGIANLYKAETSENKFGGKFAFKAPEQYPENKIKGFAPDVFSLGVICSLLLTKKHPCGHEIKKINRRNPKKPKNGWLNWAKSGERIIEYHNHEIKEVIIQMLNSDPS